MITRENFRYVVESLSDKDKRKIINNVHTKEYCVLDIRTTNCGMSSYASVTNDYNKYKNVYKNGNCIVYLKEVYDIITTEKQHMTRITE